MSVPARLALVLALFLALGAGVWKVRHDGITAGRGEVQSRWDAEKLAASEKSRLDERARSIANEGVDRDLQADKQRRAAADRATGDRLRDLTASLALAHSTAPGRADDPRGDIASECAGALREMDAYAGRLAVQVAGLQGFARNVCVSK